MKIGILDLLEYILIKMKWTEMVEQYIYFLGALETFEILINMTIEM